MSDPWKPTVSPLQLRDELETMVLKELLGPGSAEEVKQGLHEKKRGAGGEKYNSQRGFWPITFR